MSRRLVLAALAALAWAAPARASQGPQEGFERVEVRVSAVLGGSVYLDRGRDARIEPGDRVRLFPTGAADVQATVRSVARESSRAEPDGARADVPIGTRGEVLVPLARAAPAEAQPAQPTAGAGAAPPHPPWAHPPEAWSQDLPLLAPALGTPPDERDSEWRGHAFVQADGTWDREDDERRYTSARSGVDLELTNPFGRGGGLEIDLEAFTRMADVADGEDEEQSRARLERLSTWWGGERGTGDRWEVGRFLHSAFPELGVLDGVEWVRRQDGGDLYGASLGLMPEPTVEMETGDDAQVSVFYRHFAGPGEELAVGAAFQKTWHQGAPDRDLFVGTLDWQPAETVFLHGTAWVDLYTSGDDPKSSGPELTQANLLASWRPSPRGGALVSLSTLRWPQLERDEFARATPELVEDFDVQRASLSVWRDLTEALRLSARADGWEGEHDDGFGGELRLGLRDLLYEDGEVGVAVFDHEGASSSVSGLRLSAARASGRGAWTLSYELSESEQEGFSGEQRDLTQHALRAAWDRSLGADWHLSLYGDQRFGDELDATSIGFYLQRRF